MKRCHIRHFLHYYVFTMPTSPALIPASPYGATGYAVTAPHLSLRGFCLSLFFIGKILVYFVLCRPIGGSSFRPSSGYCLVTYFRPPSRETMPHPPLSSSLCVHDANQPRLDSGFTLRCNWICCNKPPLARLGPHTIGQ